MSEKGYSPEPGSSTPQGQPPDGGSVTAKPPRRGHVRIRLDGNGRGSTEIDGVNLAGVVHSMKLTTKAGEPAHLQLGIWCELLEVEGPVEQIVKLLESAEAAADAKVIGVTEYGDLVFPPPDPQAEP